MKFLYPEFLYGLFALSIPIIIHLFNFRRSRKIYFSSTRFLKFVKQSTRQKLKLKHYLTLLSRLLFILFIVLAFAQPYIPASDKNPRSENVLIYLDNSQSMSNRIAENITGLEQGLQFIQQITSLYPTNTNYKILTNDFDPFSNSYKTKDEIEDLITEINQSNVFRSFQEAYSRLKAGYHTERSRSADVYFLSDFQRSTAGNLTSVSIDSADQIILVPIEFPATTNVFVDTLFLDNPFLTANERNAIHISLRNLGEEPTRDLILRLFINDIQSASASVNIDPNGNAEVVFDLNFQLEDINSCRITFDDFPMIFDNDFYFTLRLEDRISVLEIKDIEAVTYIQDVYGNESLYRFNSQNVQNIDYSNFRQADLVILNGLREIDASLSTALENYLENRGVLLIIPGEEMNLSSIEALTGAALSMTPEATTQSLSQPDFSNPFFENIFEGVDEQLEMPFAKSLIQWQNDLRTIFEMRNGARFLSEFSSAGTVFLLATPLSDTYTNFHKHALFVPVMYKMALLGKHTYSKLYYNINQPIITLTVDSLNRREIFKLTSEQEELIPAQRISGNELVLEIPKFTIEPGTYQLRQGERPINRLSFDMDKMESILSQYSIGEIDDLFSNIPNITIFDSTDVQEFKSAIKKKKFGVPLWKYAVILALVFLLIEVLLIRLL